jgi:hypothetical protein
MRHAGRYLAECKESSRMEDAIFQTVRDVSVPLPQRGLNQKTAPRYFAQTLAALEPGGPDAKEQISAREIIANVVESARNPVGPLLEEIDELVSEARTVLKTFGKEAEKHFTQQSAIRASLDGASSAEAAELKEQFNLQRKEFAKVSKLVFERVSAIRERIAALDSAIAEKMRTEEKRNSRAPVDDAMQRLALKLATLGTLSTRLVEKDA